MDGIHDLGGMAGFGPIEFAGKVGAPDEESALPFAREPAFHEEPTFHEEWEQIAFRLNIASITMLAAYNADEYRHSIERMDPTHYLQATYYERVLTGVTTLLVEKSLLDIDELELRAGGRFPLARPATPNSDDGRIEQPKPRFSVGDRVRVREMHPPGHTRVPRYVRGHSGQIIHVAPSFSFPDASAHDLPRRREATYHVEFTAGELWGNAAEADESIVVDLWESYLEESTQQ